MSSPSSSLVQQGARGSRTGPFDDCRPPVSVVSMALRVHRPVGGIPQFHSVLSDPLLSIYVVRRDAVGQWK